MSDDERKNVIAEDWVFSDITYELLQGAATADGVPVQRLTVPEAAATWWLAHLGLVRLEKGRVVATDRGQVVSRAEMEQVPGASRIRVRAGSLWATKLSRQWAALGPGNWIPWGG